MQLNEILEENSVKMISKKTNISEENLEALLAGEFDLLKKVKAMGFISIIEREYNADLTPLKKQAAEYYEAHMEDESITLDIPSIDPKKDRSPFFVFMVLLLLAAASWYFITQFDQKRLRGLLQFNEEGIVDSIKRSVDSNPDLSIEYAISQKRHASEENVSEAITTKAISTSVGHSDVE